MSDVIALKGGLKEYEVNTYPHHSRESNGITYWQHQAVSVLSRFALTILSTPPSSASVERLFSKLSRTKTKSRSRMTVERLTSIGKIKIDALNNPIIDKENQDEQEEFAYEPFDFTTQTIEVNVIY